MGDISKTLPLQRSSVQSAHRMIMNYIHETPVLTCSTLNRLASAPQSPDDLVNTAFEGDIPARPRINFFFKCENFQHIGAFKARGAFHALARLSDEELRMGVVTHSSGNHAQALALAARTYGIPAYIVMPEISIPSKIAATKSYGAEVIFSGSTEPERLAVVAEVVQRTHATLVPPFDHPNIILGQGTCALELEIQVHEMIRNDPRLSVHHQPNHASRAENGIRDMKATDFGNLDAVIAPCGGGGLLSGIATALAPTPTIVYGAEPSFQGADDARRGLAEHRRITSVASLTIADGVRTPVGAIPWTVISDRTKCAGVYAVSEAQIRAAMRLVLERMKIVVEPSAVLGLAVALWDEGFRRVVEREGGEEGWDVGVIFSGGNVDLDRLEGLIGGKEE